MLALKRSYATASAGSDPWERAKRRAEKVIDVAAELLDIYARRELKLSIGWAEAGDYARFREFRWLHRPANGY